MGFWNDLARASRNARALGAASALFLAIGVMLSLRCNPVVERTVLEAEVLKVEATGLRDTGGPEPKARIVVRTPKGIQLRLLVPPPVPEVGERVPLQAEHHRNGKSSYRLNLQKWRTDGPHSGNPPAQPGSEN